VTREKDEGAGMSARGREDALLLMGALVYGTCRVPVLGILGRGDGSIPKVPGDWPHDAWRAVVTGDASGLGIAGLSDSVGALVEAAVDGFAPIVGGLSRDSGTHVQDVWAASTQGCVESSAATEVLLAVDAAMCGLEVRRISERCAKESDLRRRRGVYALYAIRKGSVVAWFGGGVLPAEFTTRARTSPLVRGHGGIVAAKDALKLSGIQVPASKAVHYGGGVFVVPHPACVGGLVNHATADAGENVEYSSPVLDVIKYITDKAAGGELGKGRGGGASAFEGQFIGVSAKGADLRDRLVAEWDCAKDGMDVDEVNDLLLSSGLPTCVQSIEGVACFPRVALHAALSMSRAVVLRAVRDIAPGSELLADYGPYWTKVFEKRAAEEEEKEEEKKEDKEGDEEEEEGVEKCSTEERAHGQREETGVDADAKDDAETCSEPESDVVVPTAEGSVE
jgi:hypothetical protein